ncbi:hypothetical protein [Fournierella sp.]|uniref:hypothetical protein n=1 Tax=Allofournierella sp. TaxID=1940256 RepID=UPI003079460A
MQIPIKKNNAKHTERAALPKPASRALCAFYRGENEKVWRHRTIPDGGACRKFFCEMKQKAQASLGGLASIFGKYREKFRHDTPSESLDVNCVVLPWE